MLLVFDIGATKTRIGVSSDGRRITDSRIINTAPNFDTAVADIGKAGSELAGGAAITAAAGGVAGPLDSQKEQLVRAPNLPKWNLRPLKQQLELAWHAPVYLENDTVMIGIGEATAGAGQGNNIVAYVTVSTGVGGARIVNGRPDDSSLGFEPGHHIIGPDNVVCACGGRGHLEALVGGAALTAKYGKDPANITDKNVWLEITGHLARGLNNVIVFWSPDIIVLGGSVMKSIDLEGLRRQVATVCTIFPSPPPIVGSQLAENAGLAGALVYLDRIGRH